MINFEYSKKFHSSFKEQLSALKLLWYCQKGFECEEKPNQLDDVQEEEYHLITCMSGAKESYVRQIYALPKRTRNGSGTFLLIRG